MKCGSSSVGLWLSRGWHEVRFGSWWGEKLWHLAYEVDEVGIEIEAKIEGFHFIEGLIGRPAFHDNAIGSNGHAGALGTPPAMNVNGGLGILFYDLNNAGEFLFAGCAHTTHWGCDIAHAETFHDLLLIRFFFAVGTEVDHDANTQFGKLSEALFRRLCAAKYPA